MQNRPLFRSIFKNYIWNLSGIIATRIGSLIFMILLARYLLPERYGIYSLAMSIAFFFSSFTDMGLGGALTRYVSHAFGKNNKNKLAGYFQYFSRIKLLLISLTTSLLIILAYPLSIYIFKKPDLAVPLFLFAIYSVFYTLEGFYNSFFVGLKLVKYTAMREAASQIVRMILVLIVFIYLPEENYIAGVIICLTMTAILGILYLRFNMKKLTPEIFGKTSLDEREKRKIITFLKAILITGLSGIAFVYIDSMMLGIFIPEAKYLGFYRAAYTLIFSIIGLLSLANMLLPYLTQMKNKEIEDSAAKVFRFVNFFTVPAVFGILILGRYFINAIFGPEYLDAALPLYFLAPLIFIEGLSGIYSVLFIAKEKPNKIVRPFLIATVMNILLNIIFIYLLLNVSFIWAATGAGIATTISRAYYMIRIKTFVKKELKLNIKVDLAKIIISSLIMSLAILIVINYIPDINWIWGAILVVIGVIIYFATTFALKVFNKDELRLIYQFKKLKPEENAVSIENQTP